MWLSSFAYFPPHLHISLSREQTIGFNSLIQGFSLTTQGIIFFNQYLPIYYGNHVKFQFCGGLNHFIMLVIIA